MLEQVGPDQEQLSWPEQVAARAANTLNTCSSFVLWVTQGGYPRTRRDQVELGIARLQDYANGWRPDEEQ